MNQTPIGQANLAALIGGSIGSITGLFAMGIVPALMERELQRLMTQPNLSLFCFFIGGVVGWLAAGQIGPRLEKPRAIQRAHIVGGIIGGLIPFVWLVLLGWFLWAT
jgi:Na+/proline symporter